jgi:hypothetical protein
LDVEIRMRRKQAKETNNPRPHQISEVCSE